jgi:hypothetical protein
MSALCGAPALVDRGWRGAAARVVWRCKPPSKNRTPQMPLRREPAKWLKKKAKAGVRGYPAGTVGFYGPDNRRATKVAAAVILIAGGGEAADIRRWIREDGDIRKNLAVLDEVEGYFKEGGVRSVAMHEQIIGCPHEEGVDYPQGEACPMCPFWAGRDRFAEVPEMGRAMKARALAEMVAERVHGDDEEEP